MTIRQKLFVFIPILVIVANLVAFFIYSSSKIVQESYQAMMERMLLYREISMQAEQTSQAVERALYYRDQQHELDLLVQMDRTRALNLKLGAMDVPQSILMPVKSLYRMTNRFLVMADSVAVSMTLDNRLEHESIKYLEIAKTASFIQMHAGELINQDLALDQPIFERILANTLELNRYGIALLVISILMSVLIALWLSVSINRPLQRLAVAARAVAGGKLDYPLPDADQGDEIGSLYESFQLMVRNLNDLFVKNVESLEKDKLVKELELKALQSQIHPHFMFNTLNVISKLAYIEGASRASELAVSVSNLFRYNLRRLDEPVTLRDELQNATEYFSIQKARFQDRVKLTTVIDQHALEQKIPCLTLQPLLENAFVHGIEGMESGAELQLIVEKFAHSVQVTISDNGAGMSEEVLRSFMIMNEATVKGFSGNSNRKTSTGLGTQNVFRRLMLFYGEQADEQQLKQMIQIHSAEHAGTSIILNLPIRL
jgi:sensor histidine kinase YesM